MFLDSLPRFARSSLALALVVTACAPSSPPESPDAPPASPGGDDPGLAVLEGVPEASKAAPEASTPAEAEAPGQTPSATTDDGLDADIAALSESTRAEGTPGTHASAPAAPAGDDTHGREIVYRVTPKGLVIEIDGIHLRPEAKPFKDASGAYGIDLVVNAESFDGRQYWVNQPKEGPLSIAGKVEAKGGKVSRFVDERKGGNEEPVLSAEPRRFKQRWPGRGQPKLWPGQTVTLEVGLWGVRAESERERPVRRLFVVKMVAGNRAPAVITPPTMDWGT